MRRTRKILSVAMIAGLCLSLWSTGQAYAWTPEVHLDDTRIHAQNAGFSLDFASAIAIGDNNVDLDPMTSPDNSWHLNRIAEWQANGRNLNGYNDTREANAAVKYREAIAKLDSAKLLLDQGKLLSAKNKVLEACNLFGTSLHPLQDISAHGQIWSSTTSYSKTGHGYVNVWSPAYIYDTRLATIRNADYRVPDELLFDNSKWSQHSDGWVCWPSKSINPRWSQAMSVTDQQLALFRQEIVNRGLSLKSWK